MTTRTAEQWIEPLDAPGLSLAEAGGKGASLAELAATGFPVPPGFVIHTDAYRRFVADNDLQRVIDASLAAVAPDQPTTLELAATAIGAAFHRAELPAGLATAIDHAYEALGRPAVAVRSSATAEDLPERSFAGQQETFLDIRGRAALGKAIKDCWASLWSARAIGYRQHMRVPSDEVAMAVVVQEMVPAARSGVMFTANPTTGHRGELVIEATAGLGEELVGGTITPDSYVIDRQHLAVTSFLPGQPRPAEDVSVPGVARPGAANAVGAAEQALSAPLLRDLCRLGVRVEEHFHGTPQDIEWAIAGGNADDITDGAIWLLQARPITTLPAAPLLDVAWESPIPGAIWVRRQVVEHMPEPLSPLFAELYLRQGLEQSLTTIVRAWEGSEHEGPTIAGEMGLERFLELVIDGPFFTTVHGYAYSRGNMKLPREAIPYLVRAFIGGPIWLFRHGVAYWREEALPQYATAIARWQDVDVAQAPDDELLRGIRELAVADAIYWYAAAVAIGTAKVSDAILDGFLTMFAPGSGLRSALFLRGFPSKTLEAEAELDTIARRVGDDAELRDFVLATPAEPLRSDIPDTPAGQRLRQDLEGYFARYGHQIYNLDFVEPTLADSPLPVLLGLKARVREPGTDALSRQAAVARARDRQTAETLRSFDPVRRFLFRRLVGWAQRYAPNREEALFYVGAAWPLVRRFARELGHRLTAAGSLDQPDDVSFLESNELAEAIVARADERSRPDLARLAGERRELRDQRKRLHPPAAVPPTSGMRMGRLDFSNRETQRRNAADATVLRGFAVSPGRVTAPASVIRAPAEFARMEPGTILVCPTTTPAWTPLFAQARGLVTDIGGILAHGSIVAREYGIPAVMGTGSATQRISSGQVITIDGTAGTVDLQVE